MSKKTFNLQEWDKTVYAKHQEKVRPILESKNASKISYIQTELHRAYSNDKAHIVPVSISSEEPYERWFGMETLSHKKDAIDLSRDDGNGLPVLFGHDHMLPIGRLRDIRIQGSRLVGNLHISSNTKGDEIWNDITDGILSDMSVGYRALEMEARGEVNGIEDYLVTKWQPFEASIVSVPADPTVGINRSYAKGGHPTQTPDHLILSRDADFLKKANQVNKEYTKMTAIHDVNTILDIYCKDMEEGKKQQAYEYSNQICEKALKDDSDNGTKLPDLINRKILELNADGEIMKFEDPENFVPERQFSITNVIRSMVAKPGERTPDIGYEIEVSQELARQLGKKTDGILIPLSTRAVTVGGSGGNIVATDLHPEQFIDVLRARSQILNLPVTTLNDLVGNADIPRKTGSATGLWGNFDGTDSLTASNVTLDKISLTPKTVGGLVTFSRKLIMQGTPDIETMVRGDLADVLAQQIDIKALNGDGTANTPKGILNTTGIGSGTYTLNGDPTYADIVGMEGNLATNNADVGSLAYITTPPLMSTMKTTDVGTDTGTFIWSPGSERGQGQVNGFPAYYTSNMPAKTVLFGDFSSLVVGHWGALELDADPYSEFAKGNVSIRAFMDLDFGVRHPESFTALTESLT